MKAKFISILVIATLSLVGAVSTTSSAYARNEFVNGVFKEGQRINPIQGDLGVARWVMTVPSPDPRAGERQYFEKCWTVPGGFSCQYEVLFNGRTSPQQGSAAPVNNQGSNNQSGGIENDWAGKFDSATKSGSTWTATVRVNGSLVSESYKLCVQGNGKFGHGWYCDPNA